MLLHILTKGSVKNRSRESHNDDNGRHDDAIRRMQVDLLLESIIAALPTKKAQRTIRTLWDNDWEKEPTAMELAVSEKAISVALSRFKKAAAGIAAAPEFQEVYERIFC